MPVDLEPIGIIKRAGGDTFVPRPRFRCMANRCATERTELHLQPPTTFVGAMLAAGELALCNLNVLLFKVRDHGERGPKPALAEPAVANHAECRLTAHAIANGTTRTMSFMHVNSLKPPRHPLHHDVRTSPAASLRKPLCKAFLPRLLKDSSFPKAWGLLDEDHPEAGDPTS